MTIPLFALVQHLQGLLLEQPGPLLQFPMEVRRQCWSVLLLESTVVKQAMQVRTSGSRVILLDRITDTDMLRCEALLIIRSKHRAPNISERDGLYRRS